MMHSPRATQSCSSGRWSCRRCSGVAPLGSCSVSCHTAYSVVCTPQSNSQSCLMPKMLPGRDFAWWQASAGHLQPVTLQHCCACKSAKRQTQCYPAPTSGTCFCLPHAAAWHHLLVPSSNSDGKRSACSGPGQVRAAALPQDASCEGVEVDVNLGFLNNFVDQVSQWWPQPAVILACQQALLVEGPTSNACRGAGHVICRHTAAPSRASQAFAMPAAPTAT